MLNKICNFYPNTIDGEPRGELNKNRTNHSSHVYHKVHQKRVEFQNNALLCALFLDVVQVSRLLVFGLYNLNYNRRF